MYYGFAGLLAIHWPLLLDGLQMACQWLAWLSRGLPIIWWANNNMPMACQWPNECKENRSITRFMIPAWLGQLWHDRNPHKTCGINLSPIQFIIKIKQGMQIPKP